MSRFLVDLLERSLAAYVVSFLGLALADAAQMTHLSTWGAAAISALPAVLTVIKSSLGRLIGDPNSAAWLPRD